MGAGYKEANLMAGFKAVPSVGLCPTCNNAGQCYYRARRGHDALFCEMFDNYVPPRAERDGNSIAAEKTATKTAGPSEANGLNGLCSNCGHRDACALPKLKGGVWHCEEYA